MPVAVGRQTPAVPPDRIDYQFTWAEDFQAYTPVSTPAVEFLADIIRKNPGQVTMIAVGPLQNVGDLVRQHPDLVPLVKRVVLMSGSVGPTPSARRRLRNGTSSWRFPKRKPCMRLRGR